MCWGCAGWGLFLGGGYFVGNRTRQEGGTAKAGPKRRSSVGCHSGWWVLGYGVSGNTQRGPSRKKGGFVGIVRKKLCVVDEVWLGCGSISPEGQASYNQWW